VNPFRLIDQDTATKDLLDDVGLDVPAIVRMDDEATFRRVDNFLDEDFNWAFSGFERKVNDVAAVIEDSENGGGSYTAQAVHFDGATRLDIASLTAPDSDKLSVSFWFTDSISLSMSVSAGILGSLYMLLEDATASSQLLLSADPLPTAGAWHHFLSSAETNFPAGEKLAKIYVDDVDVTNVALDIHDPFSMVTNGRPFAIGYSGRIDDPAYFTGDFADLRVMVGASLLTAGDIPEVSRRLFIDANGKPVDPATATSSLGAAGTILLSGGASMFATNQGSGGAFTLTGIVTDASTSPSDP
jgi:hypothetical protein